ncbi:hypothetical protein GLAREA_08243 [Glarea lozoyensis ATCC 20868]|uniref:Uncharacterized protein n=1 Tax=Glarea lozoyensis (strain ATCC 20868 / MF5171) TaxID=1116229 RepID=S3CX47_GLAL2|nr:uncharacterized protein GLAREA_08243 [Glarea lozoyensis ATCC 20868]EPE24391.1 hypothetical protein GLAREA_08243 [Glarea lozoyensis ATCC 20868]
MSRQIQRVARCRNCQQVCPQGYGDRENVLVCGHCRNINKSEITLRRQTQDALLARSCAAYKSPVGFHHMTEGGDHVHSYFEWVASQGEPILPHLDPDHQDPDYEAATERNIQGYVSYLNGYENNTKNIVAFMNLVRRITDSDMANFDFRLVTPSFRSSFIMYASQSQIVSNPNIFYRRAGYLRFVNRWMESLPDADTRLTFWNARLDLAINNQAELVNRSSYGVPRKDHAVNDLGQWVPVPINLWRRTLKLVRQDQQEEAHFVQCLANEGNEGNEEAPPPYEN